MVVRQVVCTGYDGSMSSLNLRVATIGTFKANLDDSTKPFRTLYITKGMILASSFHFGDKVWSVKMKFYLAAVLIAGTVLADVGVFETPVRIINEQFYFELNIFFFGSLIVFTLY